MGEASPLPGSLEKTVSSTSRNIEKSFSRYLDSLRRCTSITSSFPAAFAKQRQNSWPPTRCPEASGFSSFRGGAGHYVTRLLQPPVSCPETRRILPSIHRLEEVKSIPHSSFVQDGGPILNYSSPPTTGMDHKDGPDGRLPSYTGPRQHLEILPLCSSRSSLSVPCPPVRALDSSMGIHQDISSCGPTVMHSRHPCPRLLRRLDYTCAFSRTESRTYTTYSSTSSITGLDDQLGQINVTTLSNFGLSGFTFQPGTSPYFPSGLFLTHSHQRPIPSVSYNSHACSENFIHHQQDVTFRPIHIQRPSSPLVSPVLVQSPVASTSAVMGYSNLLGCGLPHIPSLVSKTKCDDRCYATSSRTHPVLLHGCISQGMGRQLERSSDLRPMVRSRILTSYQLVGTGSHRTCATSLGTSVAKSIGERLLRQQYCSSIHPQTGRNTFSVPVSQNSEIVQSPGSVCDNSSSYTSSQSQEHYGWCSVPNQSTQPNRMAHPNRNNLFCVFGTPLIDMFATAENRVTPVNVSPYPDDRAWAVDTLSLSWDDLGLVYAFPPAPIVPKLSKNPKIWGNHGHHDCVTTSIPTVAPSSSTVEHTSSNSSPGRQPVPVCAQPQTPPISPRSTAIGFSRMEIIRDVLKSHHFPDTVVDMAANPLRDSSSNVYNSHWKAFALWANNKGILPSDLSYITLAEYLVYLFSQNKKMNTIQVHKVFISSVLKLLNPPTAIQEETLHNVIRGMTILRPREPPFAIHGTDKNISLELLSYKTAFLVALATGAQGSELVALSRASHNLEFSTLASGAKHASIRMVPKFIPKNQRPEIIPEPMKFPGIAHLFPDEPERLLCPVRALGLYIVRSAERAQDDSQEKLFVHFIPATQMFTTHLRRLVAETIRLMYENSSEPDLPKIKAHDVRGISASIAFYRNTPLKELCGLNGWKSSNVFVCHYLRDMAADTEIQDIPLVAAQTAFL